jgi:phosphoribosylanthranilate isomerase
LLEIFSSQLQAAVTVRPAGVDSHTGIEDSDGSRNLAKIHAFTQAALGAFKITEVSVRA